MCNDQKNRPGSRSQICTCTEKPVTIVAMAAIVRGWRNRYLFYFTLILIVPLLFLVLNFHQNDVTSPVGVTQNPSRKPDHLILGTAAGQGLPNRLQCSTEGIRAINKDEFLRKREIADSKYAVSFVTVFTMYNSTVGAKTNDLVTVGNVSYSKEAKSMAVLNTFIDFIQVSMPRSRVIILTDPNSSFSVSKNTAALLPIKGDYSRDQLMLQRIKSYIAFLRMKIEQGWTMKSVNNYIFTDSDVAMVDDLGHIFGNYPHFDMALTFRNNKDQPLNSGFIAVRGTPDGLLKAKKFLQEVLDVYISKYMKSSRMLGDQLALVSVVKAYLPFAEKRFKKPEIFHSELNGVSILFLPCAIYNWTPPEGAGQFHGMPLDVKVVHFKGSRKRLMLESWNFFNSTSSLPDMLCLILRSGRTKYDF